MVICGAYLVLLIVKIVMLQFVESCGHLIPGLSSEVAVAELQPIGTATGTSSILCICRGRFGCFISCLIWIYYDLLGLMKLKV